MFLALAGKFFTTEPPGKPLNIYIPIQPFWKTILQYPVKSKMFIQYYAAGRLLEKIKTRRTTATNFAHEYRETGRKMFTATWLVTI